MSEVTKKNLPYLQYYSDTWIIIIVSYNFMFLQPLDIVSKIWANTKRQRLISFRFTLSLDGTVKPVLSGHSKRRPKLVFKTNYCLIQIKSIAECSKGSILQYLRPSLSYHLSLSSLICLFLSGRLRQVLL